LLVGGSSATLKDDGLEAEWVPPPPKGADGATEGPTNGWTDVENLLKVGFFWDINWTVVVAGCSFERMVYQHPDDYGGGGGG
jgi:hypothetical protein